jgi:hypothetical protein
MAHLATGLSTLLDTARVAYRRPFSPVIVPTTHKFEKSKHCLLQVANLYERQQRGGVLPAAPALHATFQQQDYALQPATPKRI